MPIKPEFRKAYNAAYHAAHKQRENERSKAWHHENPETARLRAAKWYAEHKQYAQAKFAAYRAANREQLRTRQKARYMERKAEMRSQRLHWHYKLTQATLDALLFTQHGCCAICKKPISENGKRGGASGIHVDHDHACCPGRETCGRCVRGLLCSPCNLGLGALGDSPERLDAAAVYLRAANERRKQLYGVIETKDPTTAE